MNPYRVQHVSPDGAMLHELEVIASSPEEAVAQVVPTKLSRGQKAVRSVLKAKVYSTDSAGTVTLVRFYEGVDR